MKRLYYRAKAALRPKALVLMYHRIAEPDSDVWEIAVRPKHFEEHLQVLQKSGMAVSLRSLATGLRQGKLKRGSIALTFDDGYADNFTIARPLLEQYQIPATFFITTGNLGQKKEFWWDELEQLFLFTRELPQNLKIHFGEQEYSFDFGSESHLSETLLQAHRHWQASTQAAPSLRARNYLQIWQQLQPLPHTIQQKKLQELRAWAGLALQVREDYLSMSIAQLQELAGNPLFDIGIHTLTHPALACHDQEYQQAEIAECRQFLAHTLGNPVDLLAYPFGINNATTIAIAAEEKLLAACTTKEEPVSSASHPYRMGRYQVKDWSGSSFSQYVQQWPKISLIKK